MQRNAVFPGHLANGLNRFNRPDFIVCHLDADQAGTGPDRLPDLLRGNDANPVRFQPCHLPALALQPLAGIEDRVMLNLRCNDMTPLGKGLCRPHNGPVIGLGPAGCEIDFPRLCTQNPGQLFPGFIQCPPGPAPCLIDAARIPPYFL